MQDEANTREAETTVSQCELVCIQADDMTSGRALAFGADANPCHDLAGIGKENLAISAITRRR